jgi:hypothetical protein
MTPGLTCDIKRNTSSAKERATGFAKGSQFSDQCSTQMPLKVVVSHFSLKEFGSYSRFDNDQEKKLLSSLDHDHAML